MEEFTLGVISSILISFKALFRVLSMKLLLNMDIRMIHKHTIGVNDFCPLYETCRPTARMKQAMDRHVVLLLFYYCSFTAFFPQLLSMLRSRPPDIRPVSTQNGTWLLTGSLRMSQKDNTSFH